MVELLSPRQLGYGVCGGAIVSVGYGVCGGAIVSVGYGVCGGVKKFLQNLADEHAIVKMDFKNVFNFACIETKCWRQCMIWLT